MSDIFKILDSFNPFKDGQGSDYVPEHRTPGEFMAERAHELSEAGRITQQSLSFLEIQKIPAAQEAFYPSYASQPYETAVPIVPQSQEVAQYAAAQEGSYTAQTTESSISAVPMSQEVVLYAATQATPIPTYEASQPTPATDPVLAARALVDNAGPLSVAQQPIRPEVEGLK